MGNLRQHGRQYRCRDRSSSGHRSAAAVLLVRWFLAACFQCRSGGTAESVPQEDSMSARMRTARLVFAGGGTGGHLFPAVAIADRVKELLGGRADIVFVGTERGVEYRLRDTLGYPLHTINAVKEQASLTEAKPGSVTADFDEVGNRYDQYRISNLVNAKFDIRTRLPFLSEPNASKCRVTEQRSQIGNAINAIK